MSDKHYGLEFNKLIGTVGEDFSFKTDHKTPSATWVKLEFNNNLMGVSFCLPRNIYF